MSVAGSHDPGIDLPRQLEIVGIFAFAPDERVVLFNCASGLKYPMPLAGKRLKLGSAVDWRQLTEA